PVRDRSGGAGADPRSRGTLAGGRRRVRWRRFERDRCFRRVPRRRRAPRRSRGGRRSEPRHRPPRRPARRAQLGARRRGRTDRRRALDLRGPRLPGRRARARRAARLGPRRVRAVHRRGSARRLPPPRRDRRDHPGARELARPGPRAGPRRGARAGLPLRPRGQGPRRGPRSRVKTLAIYLVCEPETPELAEAAVDGGADLIELGFPFSDPLAEGPTIRLASERALARGMRTKQCLECLAQVRARVDVPIVPMTYAAILEAYGYERFVADTRAAGATSAIVVDLPVEEHAEVPRVQLVAPTSTDERIAACAGATDGW